MVPPLQQYLLQNRWIDKLEIDAYHPCNKEIFNLQKDCLCGLPQDNHVSGLIKDYLFLKVRLHKL